MSLLPAGIDPSDQIEIEWDRTDKRTRVVARLGGARFIVKTDDESSHLVPWLVASAPQILEAAWAAIENNDAQEAPW